MPQFLPHEAATAGDPNFSNAETFNVDVATVAPSNGQGLAFNAAANVWRPADAGGGGLIQVDEYQTTGSGADYTIPADTTILEIIGCGAGGGGGGGVFVNYGGVNINGEGAGSGGGGAGAYCSFFLPVVSGQTSITGISIGLGGTSGGRSGTGGTGGNTTFTYNGTSYVLNGGTGGNTGASLGPTNNTDVARGPVAGGISGNGGSANNFQAGQAVRGNPGGRGGQFVAATSNVPAASFDTFFEGDPALLTFTIGGSVRCAPGGRGGDNPFATGGQAISGQGSLNGHSSGGAGGGGAGLAGGDNAGTSGDDQVGGVGGRGGLIIKAFAGTTRNTI